MSSIALNLILEKISSRDKDFRYMATSDLANELAKPHFIFDTTTETQVINIILNQLEDQSSDISNLATKCLGLLINKVQASQVPSITTNLVQRITTAKKEQQRDVAFLGLKTIIANVESSRASAVANAAAQPLIQGLSSEHTDIVSNSLEILTDILTTHGDVLPQPDALRLALMPELDQSRAGIRKKAIQCLAILATWLPSESLDALCNDVFTVLESSQGIRMQQVQTYVQALSALCKNVGYKMGKHMSRAVPIMIQRLTGASQSDDELMELCLLTLESAVNGCPQDCKAYLDQLIGLCLTYIKYDPNYEDDDVMDDDGNDNGDDGDAGDEEEDEDYESYSDDEDSSWKVRRAAAKLSTAIIVRYTDVLDVTYARLAPALVKRFKDREEAVRPDVYEAYIALIEAIADRRRQPSSHHHHDIDMTPTTGTTGTTTTAAMSDSADALLQCLANDTPGVIRAAATQLKGRSAKSKVLTLKVLQELAKAVPHAVGECMNTLVPGIKTVFADTSSSGSAMKTEALQFCNAVAMANPPETFQSFAATLAPSLFTAAEDKYYAVSAEAYKACELLIKVMRPQPPAPLVPGLSSLVSPLTKVVMSRLSAQDQSQEVKDAVISCAGVCVAWLGDELQGETEEVGTLTEEFAKMPKSSSAQARKKVKKSDGNAVASPSLPSSQITEILNTISDRLRNETTRLTAVKALTTIARSPLSLDLTALLTQALPELTTFLRKTNRQLRLSALSAITALIHRDGPRIDPQSLRPTITEASALLTNGDLSVAAASLTLLETVVKEQARSADDVCANTLPRVVELVQSPLLQGIVQTTLHKVLVALASSGCSAASFDKLVELLSTAATSDGVSTVTHAAGASAATSGGLSNAAPAAARCVAALCLADDDKNAAAKVDSTAKTMLSVLQNPSSKDAEKRFALLCLGELGKESDFSSFSSLPSLLTEALSSEPIAEAASLALGSVAAGSLASYLPLIQGQIATHAENAKLQYQLLRALNEAISATARHKHAAAASTMTSKQVEEILSLLLSDLDSEEEECRTVVSECLGHLTIISPEIVLPALHKQLTGKDASAADRSVAVSALKHAVSDKDRGRDTTDPLLAEALPSFLQRMSDEDVGVRRAGVQLLSAVLHDSPSLMNEDTLAIALPLLFTQTKPDPSLVRTVNLGPFKHQIDDGLELRKAAYECIGVLMSKAYNRVDPGMLLEALMEGLTDHFDVKMRCHALLITLCTLSPNVVSSSLDALVEPLQATLTAKVKQNAVKQEIDRNEDMLRSCLRAVDSLQKLPSAGSSMVFKTFMESVVNAGGMKERYEAVKKERMEGVSVVHGSGGGGSGGGGPEAMDIA